MCQAVVLYISTSLLSLADLVEQRFCRVCPVHTPNFILINVGRRVTLILIPRQCFCQELSDGTASYHPSQCVFVSLTGQDRNDDTAAIMSMSVVFCCSRKSVSGRQRGTQRRYGDSDGEVMGRTNVKLWCQLVYNNVHNNVIEEY